MSERVWYRIAAHAIARAEARRQYDAQLAYELDLRGLEPLRIPRGPLVALGLLATAVWIIGWVSGGTA